MKDFFIVEPKRPVAPDLPEDELGPSPGGGGTHNGEDLLPLMPDDGEGGNNRPEKPGIKPIDYKEPVPGGSSDGGSGSGSSTDGSSGSGNGGSSEGGSGNDGGSSGGSSGDSGGTGGTDGGETSPENGSSEGGSDSETINDGSSDGPTVPEDSEDLEGGLTDNQEQKPTKPGKPKKDEFLEDDTPTVPPVTTSPPTQGVAPNPQPPTPNTEEVSEEGGTESPLPEEPKEENPPGETPLEGSEEGQTEEGIEQSSQTTTQTSTQTSNTDDYRQNQWQNLGTMTEYKVLDGEPASQSKGIVSSGVKPSYLVDQVLFTQGQIEEKVMIGEEFSGAKNKMCFVTSLVNVVSSMYTDITGKRANKDTLIETVKKAGKTDLAWDETRNIIADNGRVNDTITFLTMLTDAVGLSELDGKWSETRIDGFEPTAGRYNIYKTGSVNGAGHFSSNVYGGNEVYDVYDGKYKMLDETDNAFTCGNGVSPVCQTRVYDFRFGY